MEVREEKRRKKRLVFKKIVYISCLFLIGVAFLYTYPSKKVFAAENLLGYKNPEKIIISLPSKDRYETTSSKISILGTCDPRYALSVNGNALPVTEHGFFTTYVSLKVGENRFNFLNGNHTYTLTVIRKTSQGGSGGGGGTSPLYKTVKNKIGELIYPYTMPYQSPGVVKIDYLPLTQNTTFRIVGEIGSYYKLPDGTYVLKSSVRVYPYQLPENEISSAKVKYDEATHTVEVLLQMDIDALYDVIVTGNKVKFLLYDTNPGKNPAIPDNPLVKSVSVSRDSMSRTVYTFVLKEEDSLCGFDVRTSNGSMVFSMKYRPILEKKGSLKGAVILLDAGHGGSDGGTLGAMGTSGPVEKDINLDIALKTKELLTKLGATVIMTREQDKYLTLNERVEMIRTTRPDLSVSIHGNALSVTSDYLSASGFLTYYSYNNITNAAGTLNTSILNSLKRQSRTIRKANLSLTRLTGSPAVLLETAFLTNPDDYEFLLREKNRNSLAEAICKGISDYLNETAEFLKEATYIVKRGDTLTTIARKYKTTVAELAKKNGIKNINVIHTGTELILP